MVAASSAWRVMVVSRRDPNYTHLSPRMEYAAAEQAAGRVQESNPGCEVRVERKEVCCVPN